jgi:hypothetical protein
MHAGSGNGYGRMIRKVVGFSAGFSHDKNATMQLQHVDVMPVELGKYLGTHDLVGGAAGGPTLR